MRGAPGVTLEGDGVTHEGEGLLLRGGPPHEQVSRTELVSRPAPIPPGCPVDYRANRRIVG